MWCLSGLVRLFGDEDCLGRILSKVRRLGSWEEDGPSGQGHLFFS